MRDYGVSEKFKVEVPPDEITGILHCANPNCVSNHEHTVSRFHVVSREPPLKVRCHYCERTMEGDEILRNL